MREKTRLPTLGKEGEQSKITLRMRGKRTESHVGESEKGKESETTALAALRSLYHGGVSDGV